MKHWLQVGGYAFSEYNIDSYIQREVPTLLKVLKRSHLLLIGFDNGL